MHFNLRDWWAEQEKKAKDWREKGEIKLLEQMHDAYAGLKELGWREAMYAPRDGTRFLSIEAGSTGAHVCWCEGEWPNVRYWVESAGDVWSSRPILYKPMPAKSEGDAR